MFDPTAQTAHMANIFFFLLISALCPLSSCLYHQYYFVNMNMNWTEAQSYCRQNYTDLATIDSTEEMTRLISSVDTGYSGTAWIGLYNDVNSWRWSLDGRRLYGIGGTLYDNWFPGEPNNYLGIESCVQMYSSGLWNDMPCSSLLYSVCYNGKPSATQRYIVFAQPKSWTDAQTYCRQYYTDLASVNSQSENQQIQSLVQYYSSAWIGLYRDTWKWSDGENATFLSWQTGKPNNALGNENCALQYLSGDQKWSDARCDGKYPFFCYGAVRTTTAPTTSTTTATTTSSTTQRATTTPTTTATTTTTSAATTSRASVYTSKTTTSVTTTQTSTTTPSTTATTHGATTVHPTSTTMHNPTAGSTVAPSSQQKIPEHSCHHHEPLLGGRACHTSLSLAVLSLTLGCACLLLL